MWRKINKLGLALAIINIAIIMAMAYGQNFDFSGGFGLMPILLVEIPASFIIVIVVKFLANFFPLCILFPILAIIFGGLQWYFVGWFISKIKQRFFPSRRERGI